MRKEFLELLEKISDVLLMIALTVWIISFIRAFSFALLIKGSITIVLIIFLTTFVHELGHWLVLCFSGIKIKKIVIGTGPIIFKKRTLEISLFLLIAGIDFDFDRKYHSLKFSRKILIFISGSLINIFLGIFLIIPALKNPQVYNEITETFSSINSLPFNWFIILGEKIISGGLLDFFVFCGLFSILVGSINLLLVPGLDGWWLLSLFFHIPEKENEIISQNSISIINLISRILIIILIISQVII